MNDDKMVPIGFVKSVNVFSAFKNLLSDSYWWIVNLLFVTTRNYEKGLLSVDYLIELNEKYKNKLKSEEFIEFEAKIIEFKLILLDKADRWAAYVFLYESLLNDREKTLEKHKPFTIIDREDKRLKLTTALILQKKRYRLIKKKLKRELQGKKTGNLKHHPQSELSDEEIERRISWIRDITF
jgi:hypothetical protein